MTKISKQDASLNITFTSWMNRLEQQAKDEVKKEINQHFQSGNPIFYERDNKLIMKSANGKCFEYKLIDGHLKIIREVEPRSN